MSDPIDPADVPRTVASASPSRRWATLVAALVFLIGPLGCGGGQDPSPESSSTTPSASTTASDALFGPAGGLGDECVTDGDCRGDRFCDRTVPGGQCTAPCQADADCGDDAVCYEVDPAAPHGFCFPSCRASSACRSDEFRCLQVEGRDGVGICGFDVAAVAPQGPTVGAPCRATVECGAAGSLEAYCIAEIDERGTPTGFSDGMCVALGCSEEQACPDGTACLLDAPFPYCAPSCALATDCRAGYACDEERSVCVPDTP